MILVTIIYIFCITYSIISWYSIYKKHNNLFWIYFYIFTILAWIWFMLYYLFFSWINDYFILLIISKLSFSIWLLATYSLLFSVYFFKTPQEKYNKYTNIITIFYIIVILIFNFTDYIILDLKYSFKDWVFREIYWEFFNIYLILQFIFILSFIVIWLTKNRSKNNVNKLRLKYIYIFSYIFLFSLLFLQLVLPYFWIWVLEQQLIIIFAIYVYSIVYILKKYYFLNLLYGIWKIIVFTLSLINALIILTIVNKVEYFINSNFLNIINNDILSYILVIISYILTYNFLNKWLIWHSSKIEIKKNIENIEYKISQVNDLEKINSILELNINKLFKNNFSRIVKITKNTKWNSLLKKVFEEKKHELIINDIVYYEENNLDEEILKESIDDKIYLVFPIFDENWKLHGYLWIWNKTFWEFYTRYEIESLKKFSFFLENHLKYIKNYQKLKNLTYNLDKEVDRKTIEYNRLINKQKEYISVISHEIKSPVSSAIFQADFIKDEVQKINNRELNKEVWILNDVLLRIWELTNTLFSSEYFENSQATLYKEKINISELILNEFDYYKSLNPDVKFIHNIDENIWFVKLDKIQFKQVLQNLITNAIKFIPQKNWVIFISLYKQKDDIIILVEDNWIWLAWVNTKKIFDRYTSTKENNIWLWLWLYLCKKIIWLHKWEITASKSKSLWWAKFKIKLNKKTLG